MADTENIGPDPARTPKLFAALVRAQAAFTVPTKSKTATVRSDKGNYSYRYSTLDELIAATRPALTDQKIACVQNPSVANGKASVVTILAHESGETWVSDRVEMPSGSRPQDAGAALTYARRYSMSAALGVAAEDDDDAQHNDAGRPQAGTVYRGDDQPATQKADGKPTKFATKAQAKRLLDVCKQHGVSARALKAFLAEAEPPITTMERIPADRYDGIVGAVQKGLVTEPKE